MGQQKKEGATGYDKFINWKLFAIPLGLLIILAVIPTPKSMLDVGVEYVMGPTYVRESFSQVSLLASWIPGVEWKIMAGLWILYLTGLGMIKVGGISNKKAFICLAATFCALFLLVNCLQLVLNQS